MDEIKVVINGAGAAAIAIGKLLLRILQLFIDRTKYLLIDRIDLILSDDDIYTFLDQTGGTG